MTSMLLKMRRRRQAQQTVDAPEIRLLSMPRSVLVLSEQARAIGGAEAPLTPKEEWAELAQGLAEGALSALPSLVQHAEESTVRDLRRLENDFVLDVSLLSPGYLVMETSSDDAYVRERVRATGRPLYLLPAGPAGDSRAKLLLVDGSLPSGRLTLDVDRVSLSRPDDLEHISLDGYVGRVTAHAADGARLLHVRLQLVVNHEGDISGREAGHKELWESIRSDRRPFGPLRNAQARVAASVASTATSTAEAVGNIMDMIGRAGWPRTVDAPYGAISRRPAMTPTHSAGVLAARIRDGHIQRGAGSSTEDRRDLLGRLADSIVRGVLLSPEMIERHDSRYVAGAAPAIRDGVLGELQEQLQTYSNAALRGARARVTDVWRDFASVSAGTSRDLSITVTLTLESLSGSGDVASVSRMNARLAMRVRL